MDLYRSLRSQVVEKWSLCGWRSHQQDDDVFVDALEELFLFTNTEEDLIRTRSPQAALQDPDSELFLSVYRHEYRRWRQGNKKAAQGFQQPEVSKHRNVVMHFYQGVERLVGFRTAFLLLFLLLSQEVYAVMEKTGMGRRASARGSVDEEDEPDSDAYRAYMRHLGGEQVPAAGGEEGLLRDSLSSSSLDHSSDMSFSGNSTVLQQETGFMQNSVLNTTFFGAESGVVVHDSSEERFHHSSSEGSNATTAVLQQNGRLQNIVQTTTFFERRSDSEPATSQPGEDDKVERSISHTAGPG